MARRAPGHSRALQRVLLNIVRGCTLVLLATCRDAGVSPDIGPAISVNISGLTGNVSADVTLIAPDGRTHVLRASDRIPIDLAGDWRLIAAPVSSTDATWEPDVRERVLALRVGDSTQVDVHYQRVGAAFTIILTGLPPGVPGNVHVTGPASFSLSVSHDTILTGLAEGVYVLHAVVAQDNRLRYTAVPSEYRVNIASSLNTPVLRIAYERAFPTLDVHVSGLPPGTAFQWRVTELRRVRTEQGSPAQTITLSPGAYTLEALPTADAFGNVFVAAPARVERSAVDGERDSVSIRYARTSGTLVLNVRGLPQGSNAILSIAQGNQVAHLTGFGAIDLSEGAWTLSAQPVTVSGVRYVPTPASVPIAMTNGRVINAAVVYSSAGATPFNVVLDGAYVSQVIQKPDGSVPLVAGRPALLRVFAHANFSNQARVPVEARLYRGPALIETLRLMPALSSVTTSVSEGELPASWNAVLPAALIQPDLRIAVEIDPDHVLNEADRSDNRWPQNGEPFPVPVHTAPPFRVQFVPVVLNNVPGVIANDDREPFLTLARQLHPLLDIDARTHAPFTSTVKNPEQLSGITLWTFLLNELQAARTAEGSADHFYGVVNAVYAKGISGIAVTGAPVALGYDLPGRRALAAAHEWGHNFGRKHAPCGNPSLPDPDYPNSAGMTGNWGWNALTGELVSPKSTDLMGYCNDVWMSAWSWSSEIAFRERAAASRLASRTHDRAVDGLLVWGRVGGNLATLEPAFRVVAPLSSVSAASRGRIDVLGAAGQTLATYNVDVHAVSDSPEQNALQFAAVVPWSDQFEARVTALRFRLADQPRFVAMQSTDPMHQEQGRSVARLQLSRSGPHVDINWGASSDRMAMVRDAQSGEVLGFVRRAGGSLPHRGRPLELVFSDGVHSRKQQLDLP